MRKLALIASAVLLLAILAWQEHRKTALAESLEAARERAASLEERAERLHAELVRARSRSARADCPPPSAPAVPAVAEEPAAEAAPVEADRIREAMARDRQEMAEALLDRVRETAALDETEERAIRDAFAAAGDDPGARPDEALRAILGEDRFQALQARAREDARAQLRYDQRQRFLAFAAEVGLREDQLGAAESAFRDRGVIFSADAEIDRRAADWTGASAPAPDAVRDRLERRRRDLEAAEEALGPALDPVQRRRFERWRSGALLELSVALAQLGAQGG